MTLTEKMRIIRATTLGMPTQFGGEFGYDIVCMKDNKIMFSGGLDDCMEKAEKEGCAVVVWITLKFQETKEKPI
jgi:hypothetical protein